MHYLFRKYGVVFAVILVVLAAIIGYSNLKPPPSSQGYSGLAFYIDEETGDESTGPADLLPPLPGKSGNSTVVQVVKVSFDDGRTTQPLYYLKYSDEAKAKLDALGPLAPGAFPGERPDIIDKGRLVRAPSPGSKWVLALSDEGSSICTLPTSPDGKQAKVVTPRK